MMAVSRIFSQTSEKQANKIRSLGILEKYSYHLNQVGPCNGALVVSVTGPITPGLARQALDWCQEAYPVLQCRIEENANDLYFVRDKKVREIPLKIVSNCPEEKWLDEVNKEINIPIDPHIAPLIRVTMVSLPDRTIFIFCRHHSISDAASGHILVRDFLMSAASAINNGKSPLVTGKFSKAREELIPEKYKGFLPGVITLMKIGANYLRKEYPVKFGTPEAGQAVKTETFRLAYDEGFTRRLRAACSEKGATVHGAICAAMLNIIASDLKLTDQAKLACTSAMSLRDLLEPQVKDDLGLYFSAVETFHWVSPATPFWELAKDIQKRVHEIRSSKAILKFTYFENRFLKKINSSLKFTRESNKQMRSSFSVSNAGLIPVFLQYGPFSLDSVEIFPTSPVIDRFAFVVGVSTFNNCLTINFNFKEGPVFGKERAEPLIAMFDRILRKESN